RRGMIRETVFGPVRGKGGAERFLGSTNRSGEPDDTRNVERSVSESPACSILIRGLRWWNVERESWWILGRLAETGRRGCGE
ncbi:hypothetical protein K0M31_005055, partial [Melipona bicolor]